MALTWLLAPALLALLLLVLLLFATGQSLRRIERRVGGLERELARLRATPLAPLPVADPASTLPTAMAVPAAQPVRQDNAPAAPRRPDLAGRAGLAIKGWFSTGNVPVKVGMLVLLAGVAALLKYASDQGWLNAPIEWRLAGVAAVALAGLAFGWRERGARREFALALQGGAIGVLLLTVFAAARLYGLLPLTAAFALSVVLVAGLGLLAVLQDALALAVLGLLAGFMAPIWLNSGSGSHVVLFSWYALLNAAVFAIAWVRAWALLNLLGFVFTWGIGTIWGVLEYRPAQFWSTEPFLLLFFAFYLLLPILHARRYVGPGAARIDGWLLFGTPLAAFTLQAALLVTRDPDASRLPLAGCALGLAAIYAVLAAGLRRRADAHDDAQRSGRDQALLDAWALLAVAFATLAVPLAFSARVTASTFALEGAALLWLGLRQGSRFAAWAGLALQAAAAIAFALGIGAPGGWLPGGGGADLPMPAHALANPTFMGALVLAVAGFASAWSLYASSDRRRAIGAYLWALLWWSGNALHEIDRFVPVASQPDALLAGAALTGWLAAEVFRRRPAAALAWTTLAAQALAVALAFTQTRAHLQPFGGYGAWSWAAFLLLGVRSLLCLSAATGRGDIGTRARQVAAWTLFVWWLAWPTALMLAAVHLAQRAGLDDGWQRAGTLLPWLLLALAALQRWRWLAWPFGERCAAQRLPLLGTCFGVLALGWLAALASSGASAPLPWLALLNPLDLVQLAVLAAAARWLWSGSTPAPAALRRTRSGTLAAAGFLFITIVTLRAVHQWGGLRWDIDLFDASLAQASLTVVWSVAGVAAWVTGSRRGQRAWWLAGAVLMGIVLAKLVLIDRAHLGNLLGIGSFIAFGLLCTLVGYIAPAPPRQPAPPGVSA